MEPSTPTIMKLILLITLFEVQSSQRNPKSFDLWNLKFNLLKFLNEGEQFASMELLDTTPERNYEYDFIIVGAGSAGATLAARLSEIEDATVLLIEAGGSENLVMDIPVVPHVLQFSNDVNWKYRTEPSNKYCLGMTDRRCNWPRGKVMGGSSVLNYMIASRGNPNDFNNWAKMGNKGWSYEDVLPYFKKLENMQIPELRRDTSVHSSKGPLSIEYPRYRTPMAKEFLEAGLEMGYNLVDYNSNHTLGFAYIQGTTKNGERMSANKAYLHPVRDRRNLVLTRNSLVEKVLVDPISKRAFGVQFIKYSRKINVRARKEVILCAGAIGSPQILMLSGIGPKRHLQEFGIKVIKNAPVGDNLIDHISYGGLIFLVNQSTPFLMNKLFNPVFPYIQDYLSRRDGPFTSFGGAEAIAFIDVDRPGDSGSRPNVELCYAGLSLLADANAYTIYGLTEEFFQKMYKNAINQYAWTVFPFVLNPKSKGRILLKNRQAGSEPRIISNYFEDPEDMRLMIKAIRTTIAISKSKGMRKFGSALHDVPVFGCETYEYDSDQYWECAVRTFPSTFYHISGTCKMGPEWDSTAVVNPRLQVCTDFHKFNF